MAKPKTKNRTSTKEIEKFRGQLLAWYDRHRRILPWRAPEGQKPDPYHVWLSEIMLQQTTVGAVKPYFEKFLAKWPTVHDLAAADQDDIMNDWAGLGYYNRARNLHACAKMVANDLGGVFPQDQKALQKLPGIGEYTSAAIRTIAFNKPANVVDGNVERVMARIYAVQDPLPKSKSILKGLSSNYFHEFEERPGDLAQALMDLGAGICIAKTPRCSLCPVSEFCEGKEQGVAETLPRKEKKKPKPQKRGQVYWVQNNKGEVLIHRRPEKGLLAGMLGLPTSEWVEGDAQNHGGLKNAKPIDKKGLSIHHSFTHFDLELELYSADLKNTSDEYFWLHKNDVDQSQFPTVFKKALKLFMSA